MKYKLLNILGIVLIYLGIWVLAWFIGEHKPTYWEWFPQFITALFPLCSGMALVMYADFNKEKLK